MTPETLVKRGVLVIALVTVIGWGVLVFVGETTEWASAETKAAPPSLEIIPGLKETP